MTFIASVIAKKGVAVIADSLVTSMERVIEYHKFVDFLREKSKSTPLSEVKIDPLELVRLFQRKPSHTKDYEEKLFKYDKFTAVTTAGNAMVGDKNMEHLINDVVTKNNKDPKYSRKRFETKVKDFCDYLNTQVQEHLNKYEEIGSTTFYFSHYIRTREDTVIYKVDINPCNKERAKNPDFEVISFTKMTEVYKVVCDGQNRISERILFGEIDFFLDITPRIIDKVINDFKIEDERIPVDYKKNFLDEAKTLLPKQFFDDMKVNKLAGLSLQQAVDLASLLMKVEINFQKYTENIPTVGGVIKIAVIDIEGFRFISGNEILKPEKIY